MPSLEVAVYSPEKQGNIYSCNGQKLDEIDSLSAEKAFSQYVYNFQDISKLEVSVPYRKKLFYSMYSTLQNELVSDPNIRKQFVESKRIIWDVPFEINYAYLFWSRHLFRQKEQLERDICKLDWYTTQNKQHSYLPAKFIEFYNSLYDSYQELLSRCKKPDVEGWTKDQAAKDYVACRNAQWRRDYNYKLRKLKKYKRLRNDFIHILEPLGKAGQLKPAYEY